MDAAAQRPLSGVKRTWRELVSMSANDPKQTQAGGPFRSPASFASQLLPGLGLDRLVNLGLDRIEIEAGRGLHRRELDSGLGKIRHALLH